MRIADAIFERLKTETTCIYMVSGGGAMFLVDALGRSGIFYIAALHEAGAGFMAIGHAMASGGLGVCLVTSGPGSLNGQMPLGAAWTDSIPLLVISGQAKSTTLIGNSGLRTRGVQEINIEPMVAHITKISYEVTVTSPIMGILDAMIKACKENRPGPCWLSIPLDIQGMESDM